MNRQRKAEQKRPEEGWETLARQGEPGTSAALSPPPSASAAALLRLQRTHGNRFVQRLLSRSAVVGEEGGPVPPEEREPTLAEEVGTLEFVLGAPEAFLADAAEMGSPRLEWR